VATHHLIQERAQVKVGDDVVVGPGPMGLTAVQYAKVCDARRVFLIGLRSDQKRLEIGEAVGADYALYSEENREKTVLEMTNDKGAEFVVECSASGKGVQHAIDCARKAYEGPGGTVAFSWTTPSCLRACATRHVRCTATWTTPPRCWCRTMSGSGRRGYRGIGR
jgi:threonine dehydrogenase-like Zn-dependent dehydrogenase